MLVKKESIKKHSLIVGTFLSFAGFYVILLSLVNFGYSDESRVLTVPLRVIILVSLFIMFVLRNKKRVSNGFLFFSFFIILYYIRIFLEYFTSTHTYHIPVFDFFLFFTSFVSFPFILLSQSKLYVKDYRYIFWSIIVGNFLLAISTIYYYGSLVGEVSRLTSTYTDLALISPLMLAYNSVLAITIGVIYIMNNKVSGKQKYLLYITIALSLIPFFFGASRGSIIALIFPIFLYFIFSKNKKYRYRIIIVSMLLLIIITLYSNYAGQGIINRFVETFNALLANDYSDVRLQLWITSWDQFVDNPLFGNSLENNIYNAYPHNLFIETLITTGIFGISCIIGFLLYMFKKISRIIKYYPHYYYITTIFLVGFVRSLFTDGIYGHSWLAFGAAVIMAFDFKKFEKQTP